MLLFLFQSLIALAYSSNSTWISPDSTAFPSPGGYMCAGHYQDLILIIAGYNTQRKLREYNITNNSFVDRGDTTITKNTYGTSQYWCQMDHILYTIDKNGQSFNIFDLSTQTFTPNWLNITIPYDVSWHGCLTSTNETLYIVGGDPNNGGNALHTVQILSLSSYKWTHGPNMTIGRRAFACIISTASDSLYSIGGAVGDGMTATVEYISIRDIHENEWNYTKNDMQYGCKGPRAVEYDTNIYIIGGDASGVGKIDLVHVIDVFTNYINHSNFDKLQYGVSFAAPIIVNHLLHVFAQGNGWQYYLMQTDAPSTHTYAPLSSASPSTAPSQSPTACIDYGNYSSWDGFDLFYTPAISQNYLYRNISIYWSHNESCSNGGDADTCLVECYYHRACFETIIKPKK